MFKPIFIVCLAFTNVYIQKTKSSSMQSRMQIVTMCGRHQQSLRYDTKVGREPLPGRKVGSHCPHGALQKQHLGASCGSCEIFPRCPLVFVKTRK